MLQPKPTNKAVSSQAHFTHRIAAGFTDTGLSLARELGALLKQSVLLPRDIAPSMPASFAPQGHLVVLLHGLLATAGTLRPLRQEIERCTESQTATFTYDPLCSVRTIALRLGAFLARVPATTKIHLIGHSLGGLAVRYYVHMNPADSRVVQTISLATPFGGSNLARWIPRPLSLRELAPGSTLLCQTLQGCQTAQHTPHTSIIGLHDLVVRPSSGSAYPHGDVLSLTGRGHNALLFDRYAIHAVVSKVASLAGRRAASSLDSKSQSMQSTSLSR